MYHQSAFRPVFPAIGPHYPINPKRTNDSDVIFKKLYPQKITDSYLRPKSEKLIEPCNLEMDKIRHVEEIGPEEGPLNSPRIITKNEDLDDNSRSSESTSPRPNSERSSEERRFCFSNIQQSRSSPDAMEGRLEDCPIELNDEEDETVDIETTDDLENVVSVFYIFSRKGW